MMSEKSPTVENEALAKKIETIQQEVTTLKTVVRRGSRTRLILLLAILVMIIPRARVMLKESPKGTPAQWISFLIPIGIVVAFVFLLMQLV